MPPCLDPVFISINKEGRPPILSSVKQPLLGVVAHAHDPSACEVGAGRLLRV